MITVEEIYEWYKKESAKSKSDDYIDALFTELAKHKVISNFDAVTLPVFYLSPSNVEGIRAILAFGILVGIQIGEDHATKSKTEVKI